MMNREHYVEHRNLSLAWGHAMRLVTARGVKEVAPLVLSITGFDDRGLPVEEPGVRAALDGLLASQGKPVVAETAKMIFPESLWNPRLDRSRLFERFQAILPRLKKMSRLNRRGVYFERLVTGGPPTRENQLEFVIRTFRPKFRRSVLQASVFDPSKDHTAAARLGFPCLQHVSFAPTEHGLNLNAFYASQFMVERAYGNYLGLCHLGRFVAHEIGKPLARVTCFTGIAERDMAKAHLSNIMDSIDGALAVEED